MRNVPGGCIPNHIRSPVLKPMITSSRSEDAVDGLTSWQVGYAEKLILVSGSCQNHAAFYAAKQHRTHLGFVTHFDPQEGFARVIEQERDLSLLA
jgi:hypothetical protein